MNISFQPKSTLSFIIVISLIALFTAILMGPVDPSTSQNLKSLFGPLLFLGLVIWIIFVILSVGRNLRLIR